MYEKPKNRPKIQTIRPILYKSNCRGDICKMSLSVAVAWEPCGTLLFIMVVVSFLTASVRALVSACLLVSMVLRTIGTHVAVSLMESRTQTSHWITLHEVSMSEVSMLPMVAEVTTAEVALLFVLHEESIMQTKSAIATTPREHLEYAMAHKKRTLELQQIICAFDKFLVDGDACLNLTHGRYKCHDPSTIAKIECLQSVHLHH